MQLSLTKQFLVPADLATDEVITSLSSCPPHGAIPPMLRVQLIAKDEGGQRLESTDFPWIGGNLPVYSREAFEHLSPVLQAYGRPIVLRTDGDGDFVGLHLDRVIDALDYGRSRITRFASGRLMMIDEHVFVPAAVTDVWMFRLTGIPRAGWTYVSERYVDAVQQSPFRGAEFELLWRA